MLREFGDLLLPAAPNEDQIVQDLIQKAKVNPRKASEMWVKIMDATNEQFGYTLHGYRFLNIDLKTRTIEITEQWGGVITARRYQPLGKI